MKKKVTRILAMIMMATLVITGALMSPIGKMKVEAAVGNVYATNLNIGDYIEAGDTVEVGWNQQTSTARGDLMYRVNGVVVSLNERILGGTSGTITFSQLQQFAPGYDYYKVIDKQLVLQGLYDVLIEGVSGTPGATSTSSNSGSVCSHTYEWVETEAATDTTDAKLAYKCSRCGHIDMWMTEANSAYIKTNREAADKIAKAPSNGTVKLETGNWTSFYRNVIDALAKRPDVTVVITYNDEQHNRKCITIPAGTDLTGYIDDKGYTGYKFLISKLGETPYHWGK